MRSLSHPDVAQTAYVSRFVWGGEMIVWDHLPAGLSAAMSGATDGASDGANASYSISAIR